MKLCQICRNRFEKVVQVKRIFDEVQACPPCAEKITAGKEQIEAFLTASKVTKEDLVFGPQRKGAQYR